MAFEKLGKILALLGLIMLLVTNWGRQRARKQKRSVSPALVKLQGWGSLAAFALILVGLALMLLQK